MKKVAMFGALWTRNFGDVLLADLFRKQVISSGYQPIFVTGGSSVLEDIGVSRVEKMELLSCDHFLFFGGGYLSEPPQNILKWSLSRYARIFVYADIARLLGKKYSIVGVGAGPCTSGLTKFLFRRFCNGAEKVIVRDEESLETLKRIGVRNKAVLACDYALSISNWDFPLVKNSQHKIALHLTSKQKELNSKIINYFSQKPTIEGGLWFIEDHPGEYERTLQSNEDLANIISHSNVVFYKSHNNFVQALNEFDYIITSKLHVGIIAAALQKRICSFPYHGKVVNFYKSINKSEICFYNTNSSIKEHLELCYNQDKVTIPDEVYKRLEVINHAIEGL